jgi:hypothetical protein
VNTDPVVSPIKAKTLHQKPIRKESSEKLREEKPREKPTLDRPIKTTHKTKEKHTTTTDLPPVTPAPAESDVFSPLDSEASGRPEGCDTPPPSGLGSTSNEAPRPSRRQRAQVSYAEPSLRDKMRRPDKKLVDAVPITKGLVSGDPRDEDKPSSSASAKREDDRDIPNWKNIPNKTRDEATSPLRSKSSKVDEDLPSTVLTDRRRKSTQLSDGASEPKPSVSQSTIAALVAGSQKRLSRAREVAEAQRRINGEKGDFDIYTFDDSPPSGNLKQADNNTTGKQSRRHSSMSDVRGGLKTAASGPTKQSDSKGEAEQQVEGEGVSSNQGDRISARRRSMMI